MSHPNKQTIIIVILALALILSIGYIVYVKTLAFQQKKLAEAYNAGTEQGYEYALSQVLQKAVTCTPVPLTYQNTTIQLIAIECLSQQNASRSK